MPRANRRTPSPAEQYPDVSVQQRVSIHTQLNESLDARDQMEHLLRVIVGLASDLDLDATLYRIVTAAMELTGAGYGALGVRGPDGTLVSFLHSGVDDATADRIGHLPVGKGVLGVLLNEPVPLRLDDLGSHPAAVGFPDHHPPMRALLGVPINIRQKMFGSLYLADPRSRPTFSESDEVVVRALASAAAVAIDNARLFDRVSAAATSSNTPAVSTDSMPTHNTRKGHRAPEWNADRRARYRLLKWCVSSCSSEAIR